MTKPEQPDAARREALKDEARRLASSGKFATWREVREALIADSASPDDVRTLFSQDAAFREELEELAEAAHGVGGPATE